MVFCNFSNIQNINKIEDVNVLENMEKELVDLLNRIQIEKVGVSFKLFILILFFPIVDKKKNRILFYVLEERYCFLL